MTIRLSTQEQAAITSTIHLADPNAEIYLFGSRVDANASGGDIDLLLLSKKITLMSKLDILAKLHHSLGQRKIDLVIAPNAERPFTQISMQTGVRLQ